MEITKSWIMTEEYTETISFEEDLIKLFIKEESIILDEDQTLEDVADEYSDDLWEWANRSKDESLKDLCEYEENQESVDGYVHEYRFKK
jgi:Rad3-related DNA helicase